MDDNYDMGIPGAAGGGSTGSVGYPTAPGASLAAAAPVAPQNPLDASQAAGGPPAGPEGYVPSASLGLPPQGPEGYTPPAEWGLQGTPSLSDFGSDLKNSIRKGLFEGIGGVGAGIQNIPSMLPFSPAIPDSVKQAMGGPLSSIGDKVQQYAEEGERRTDKLFTPEGQQLLKNGVTGNRTVGQDLMSAALQGAEMAPALGAAIAMKNPELGAVALGHVTGAQEHAAVMNTPLDQLAQQPQFQQIYAGLTEPDVITRATQAQAILAQRVQQQATAVGSVVNAVGGRIAGNIAGKIGVGTGEALAGGVVKMAGLPPAAVDAVEGAVQAAQPSALGRIALGVGTEAATGGAINAAGAAANAEIEKQNFNPQASPLEAAAQAFAPGALLAAPFGIGAGRHAAPAAAEKAAAEASGPLSAAATPLLPAPGGAESVEGALTRQLGAPGAEAQQAPGTENFYPSPEANPSFGVETPNTANMLGAPVDQVPGTGQPGVEPNPSFGVDQPQTGNMLQNPVDRVPGQDLGQSAVQFGVQTPESRALPGAEGESGADQQPGQPPELPASQGRLAPPEEPEAAGQPGETPLLPGPAAEEGAGAQASASEPANPFTPQDAAQRAREDYEAAKASVKQRASGNEPIEQFLAENAPTVDLHAQNDADLSAKATDLINDQQKLDELAPKADQQTHDQTQARREAVIRQIDAAQPDGQPGPYDATRKMLVDAHAEAAKEFPIAKREADNLRAQMQQKKEAYLDAVAEHELVAKKHMAGVDDESTRAALSGHEDELYYNHILKTNKAARAEQFASDFEKRKASRIEATDPEGRRALVGSDGTFASLADPRSRENGFQSRFGDFERAQAREQVKDWRKLVDQARAEGHPDPYGAAAEKTVSPEAKAVEEYAHETQGPRQPEEPLFYSKADDTTREGGQEPADSTFENVARRAQSDGTGAASILDHIEKNSPDQFARKIAQLIKKKLGGAKIAVNVSDKLGKGVQGHFSANKARISLSSAEHAHGVNEETFLHEALHASLHKLINSFLNKKGDLDPVSHDMLSEMDSLRKKLLDQSKGTKFEGARSHAFSSLHEFVSEFFGSPDFRNFLKSIDENGKPRRGALMSFYDRIVDLISRLFRGSRNGLAPSEDPIAHLMSRADDLFNPSRSHYEHEGAENFPWVGGKNADREAPEGSLARFLGDAQDHLNRQDIAHAMGEFDSKIGNALPKRYQEPFEQWLEGVKERVSKNPILGSIPHWMKYGQPLFMALKDAHYQKFFDTIQGHIQLKGRIANHLQESGGHLFAGDHSILDQFKYAARNKIKSDFFTDAEKAWVKKNLLNQFDANGRNRKFSDQDIRQMGGNDRHVQIYKSATGAVAKGLDEMFGGSLSELAAEKMNSEEAQKLEPYLNKGDFAGAKKKFEDLYLNWHNNQIKPLHNEIHSIQAGAQQAGRPLDAAENARIADLQAKIQDADNHRSEIHQAVNKAWKTKNDLISQGFMPSHRFGKYAVLFKSAGPEGFSRVHYETMGEARRAVIKGRENGSLVDDPAILKRHGIAAGKDPVINDSKAGGVLAAHANNAEFEQLLNNTSLSALEKMQLMNKVRESMTSDANGRLARSMQRRGIEGSTEDLTRSLARFLNDASSSAADDRTTHQYQAAISAVPEGSGADLRKYMQKQWDAIKNPGNTFGKLRGLTTLRYLAFSPASAAINAIGGLAGTVGVMGQYRTGKSLEMLAHLAKNFRPGEDFSHLPPAERAIMEEARDRNGLHPMNSMYLQQEAANDLSAGAASRAAINASMAMFSRTETFNRKTAAMAAAHTWARMTPAERAAATAKYRLDGSGASFAIKMADLAHGVVNQGNRPAWAMGVGAIPYTFQHYPMHMLQLFKELPPQARWRMLATLAAVGGTQALPGVGNIADLIDAIGSWTGHPTQTKAWLKQKTEEAVGPKAANFLARGVSAALPVDFASRVDLADPIPGVGTLNRYNDHRGEDALGVLGAPFSALKDANDAVSNWAKGNNRAAVLGALPTGLKNLYLGGEELATGKETNANNQYVGPASTFDALAKMAGIQTSGRQAQTDIRGDASDAANIIRGQTAIFGKQLLDARLGQDQDGLAATREAIMAWNRDNPQYRVNATAIYQNAQLQQRRAMINANLRAAKSAPPMVRMRLLRDISNLTAAIGDAPASPG